jgi:ParB family chromosome partitioning protein
MKSKDNNLIYLDHKRLRLHPKNIRLFYPPEEVAEMAQSIGAAGGVWQALLIVPATEAGYWYVVDGNMRLMGARELGDNCPLLKCEVIDAGRVDQLLIMATTSRFHYPKDPISEARHFKRLIDEEGYTADRLAAALGTSRSFVYSRLLLIDLDQDIQELIMERKLTASADPLRQLLKIPDAAVRVALARRFAHNQTSGKAMAKACRHVLEQMRGMGAAEPEKETRPPATAKGRSASDLPASSTNGHVNGNTVPQDRVLAIAEKTLCAGCKIDGLGKQCYLCPGPYEFINLLIGVGELAPVGGNNGH